MIIISGHSLDGANEIAYRYLGSKIDKNNEIK